MSGRFRFLCLLPLLMPGALAAGTAEALAFADGLYRRGLHAQAATEYQSWLKDVPEADGEAADVRFRLADCLEKTGRHDAARELYRGIASVCKGERRAAAQLRLAASWLETGDAKAALPALEALVTATTASQDLRDAAAYRLGLCYEALNRPADARTLYGLLVPRGGEYAGFARLRLAAIAAGAGRHDEALTLYRAIADDAGADAAHRREAALVGGALAYRAGDYGAATALYARLDDKDLADAGALTGAAWAALRANQPEKARAWLAADRLRDPKDDDARLFLDGSVAAALNGDAEAEKAYAALLKDFPNSEYAAPAAYAWLLIRHRAGDPKAFLETYKAVAGVLPADSAAALQALRLDAAVQVRDTAQARAAASALVASGTPAQAADATYRLGWLAQQQEDWAAAGDAYLRAATAWPGAPCVPAASYAAAVAFRRANNPDRAAQALSLALTSGDPAVIAQALLLRARDELAERNTAAAAATLDEYLGRFPDGAAADEARYLRGMLFFNAQDWTAAERLLGQAAAAPALPHDRRTDAAVRRAQALHALGRTEEAAAVLQPLLGLKDAALLDPAYLNWLAEFQMARGAYAEAEAAARTLLSSAKGPDDAVLANWMIGRAAEAQGQDATALAAYTTAREASAGRETAYGASVALGLGRLAVRRGDLAAARQAYAEAAAIRGDTPEARRVRAEAFAGLVTACRANDPDATLRAAMNLIIFYDDPVLVPAAFRDAVAVLRALGRPEEAKTLIAEWKARYPETVPEDIDGGEEKVQAAEDL